MPLVSIIIPCFNEESTIFSLLQAILEQDFPTNELEVVIADGMSTDRTRQRIDEFIQQKTGLNVKIVDNPKRNIPSGLNLAVKESVGEYIVRLDGHSIPDKSYVRKCVNSLQTGKGDNVGGAWQIEPRGESWQAASIAIAAANPLAVGDAKYRIGGEAQYVDTVPFGALKKSFLVELGIYNELLQTNEDYELNARIRKRGGKIWFDPSIKSIYLASPSFTKLAKQYWRYGYWKAMMIRMHPDTLRWRQALPPLFVMGLTLMAVLGFVASYFWMMLGIGLVMYLLILLLAAIGQVVKTKQITMMIGIPTAISIMHFTWGTAFIWGSISPELRTA